eukprot:GHUV01013538.1.p1 GENE.GHUV01013538.1~~GHUV01013538.1.p1  ORF type:complete len:294 (+),score=79.44 GHUV01013538.1:3427-4308(+)
MQNEVGAGSGDAYIQCSASHVYCLKDATNAVVSDHSCCPAFGIEIVGPNLRVNALALSIASIASKQGQPLQVAVTEPLTTLMHIFDVCTYNPDYLLSVARVLKALVMALHNFNSFYQTRIPEFRDSNITGFQQLPYALAENPSRFQQPRLLNPETKMTIFTAIENLGDRTRPVLCKFVRRYGEQVHRVWADKGHAPALYEVINLVGGWQLLVMEYLSDGDKWNSVDALQSSLSSAQFSALRDAILSAVAVVHAAPLSNDSSSGGSRAHGSRAGSGLTAHGDLRAPNIMARYAH